jgi:hypothetical protein
MAEPLTVNFPASADTASTLGGDLINLYSTTLNGNITNSTLTIPTPATITGVNFPCYLRIDNELMWATSVTTSSFNIDAAGRGVGGTTAVSHSSGAFIYLVYSANISNQHKRAIVALETNILQRGTATIDFGSIPSSGKAFTVTVAGMTAANFVTVTQSGLAATGRSADENEMDILMLNAIAGTGQFTLNAITGAGPVVGKYVINYSYF